MLRSNVLVAGKFGLAGTLSILADSEINPLYKRQIHVAGGEEPKCRLWESSVKRLISRTAFCCALLAVALPADAQNLGGSLLSGETVGGTFGLHVDQPSNQTPSVLQGSRNLDVVGKPCLNVTARSEQQLINKAIYNHILMLDNHCSKQIKIKACYYKTDSCHDIAAPPYKRDRHIFGVFTTKDFRFAFREYSN